LVPFLQKKNNVLACPCLSAPHREHWIVANRQRTPMSAEAHDRLRLARTEGVGPVAYRKLLARYGTASEALRALPGLAAAAGRRAPPRVPGVAEAAREVAFVAGLGGRLLFLGDPGYPALLAELADAPSVLAVLGDPACLAAPCVAMVGSRNASANGQRLATAIAEELASAGYPVVSGLARGIDTAAHEGALLGGISIACIAGGIDVPYPLENAALQAQIAGAGAVLAEAPPGTAPQARHFPRRNRIIAGLSLATVVVEAAPRSGSLITARLAGEAGREVFAVPGSPLDPRARGANGLLRDGAHLAESAQDVIDVLSAPLHRARRLLLAEPPPPALAEPPLVGEMRARVTASVARLLGPSPTAVDDLIRRCQFSAAAVHSVLLDLELAERIETLPGNRVALLAGPA
jgi:DNA processing protein